MEKKSCKNCKNVILCKIYELAADQVYGTGCFKNEEQIFHAYADSCNCYRLKEEDEENAE